MAKFEIEGLDEVSLALRSVIDGVEDFNIELAQEAADITSLPARGAWIEIHNYSDIQASAQSLPARGAWIEIILRPPHKV